MSKPFDAYVAQQQRKAAQLEESIRVDERKRIVALLLEKFGFENHQLEVCGQIVRIIEETK